MTSRRTELRENHAYAVDRYWEATTAEPVNEVRRRECAVALANAALKLHLFDQGFRAARREERKR